MGKSSSDSSYERSRSYRKHYQDNRGSNDDRRKHQRVDRSSNNNDDKYDKQSYRYFSIRKPSDIKNHFHFDNIEIRKKNEIELMSLLGKKLVKHVGPVQHVSKIDQQHQYLSIAVGFKYDTDALDFYHSQPQGIKIKCNHDTVRVIPKPTFIFEKLIPFIISQKNRKKQVRNKRDKSLRKGSQSYSSDMRHHHRRHSQEFSRQRQSSRMIRDSPILKHRSYDSQNVQKILIFGVPTFIKRRDLITYFQQHQSGPFNILESRSHRLENSCCQYMQIIVESKKAQKILNMRDKFSYENHHLVLLKFESSSVSKICQALKQFQILVQFPVRVHPYHVWINLQSCGKIVQLVSDHHLHEDNTTTGFIITFNSVSTAYQFKKIRNCNGIYVSEPNHGQLVYRPTHQSQMFGDQEHTQNRDMYKNVQSQ